MRTEYRKGEQSRYFDIVNGKAIVTLLIGGVWVSNPTTDMLAAEGYKRVEEEPMPESEEGYYFTPRYVEEGEVIRKVWDKVKEEEYAES